MRGEGDVEGRAALLSKEAQPQDMRDAILMFASAANSFCVI